MRFVIPIQPVGQMRARNSAASGFARTYKAPKQVVREEALMALVSRFRPETPFSGPLLLGVKAYVQTPASRPKKWQCAANSGHVRPTTKPDLDNMLKHVKDCLTQMRFWEDDKLVVGYLPGTGKYYSENPRWEIEIVEFRP